MSDITLSAGVRQNLLSLQNTSAELTTTQEDLATGKKVNTAFDNPTAYFTSQSLTNRANDLSALLDQIGQAQQTIDAANNGLTSLTSLLEQALSTAQQAQQAAEPTSVTYASVALSGTVAGGYTESDASTTGSVDLSTPTEAASTLVITSGSSAYTIAVTASEALANVESAIGAATGGAITATDSGGKLIISAADPTTDFTISGSAATAFGLSTSAVDGTNLFSLLAAQGVQSGDALTISVNGGTTQSITFGTGAGEVQDFAELNTALGALTGGVTASATTSAVSLSVPTGTTATSISLGTSGSSAASTILTALGLTAGTTSGAESYTAASSTRSTLQTNYNDLLTQIDQLAGDASYNGVNLLYGDNLQVLFNETGTSSLTISGVTDTSTNLGLNAVTGAGFQDDSNISLTITAINSAISTVRAQTETFGTNSSTIQTRQTFEQNMINTLQTGASNLVLADQNEESADLLTLQTQQQLEISALSIANQANQSVLKLFS